MKNEPTIERPSVESKNVEAPAENIVDQLPDRFQNNQQAADSIDSELVNKTKNQIRNLVAEITQLSKSSVELNDFFEGFLTRTTSALASDGGAIWLDESDTGSLQLQYHVNLDQSVLATDTEAQIKHTKLLNRLRDAGEPALIPANSGATESDDGGNPTNNLLIVGPLSVNGKTIGVVEILQRTGAGPTTQRGYLRFLSQMCEIASDFLTNRKIRNFADQQNLWQQIDSFIRSIHQGLDPAQTSYAIANEGRRILGTERVSVALLNGSRCQIAAVSGLDSIERRADQVKHLQKLTKSIVKTNEALWYTGDDENLPPQIEKRLHNYLDKSHTKMLAVIPLKEQIEEVANEQGPKKQPAIIGALIVEQLKDSCVESSLRNRVELLAGHSEAALSNAIEHNSLFLMPLWKSLGQLTKPFVGSKLPRTIIGLGLVLAVIAFFALFPYPFSLSSNGQLVPQIQNEVYAQVGGILQEVFVPEGEAKRVRKDEILARMSNSDLMVQIQNLEGDVSQTREQIRKFQRAQFEKLDRLDDIILDGEYNKAEQLLVSLKRELELKKQQAAHLVVRSPADGLIVNWQVRKNLLKRPVDRGQNLMTVVDPNGGWQLEIEVPERRVGHLMTRLQESSDPVEVSFALVSHPGQEFTGTLKQIDRKLEVYSDDGNTAKAIVHFENQQLPEDLLKSGTRINAKLYCGTRSIGFVWFHELFETVETTIKYWF